MIMIPHHRRAEIPDDELEPEMNIGMAMDRAEQTPDRSFPSIISFYLN